MNRLIKYTTIGFLTILFNLLVSCNSKKDGNPHSLTVSEGFIDPIGFYDDTPTLSWKLNNNALAQSAYSIVIASSPDLLPESADLWNSGKVESGQSIHVKYKGKKLESRQQVYWKVRTWDEEKIPSKWSETATFEMGLLHNEDWHAKWISIPPEALIEKDARGSLLFRPQYMRKQVSIKSKVKSARLYITAKGIYKTYINGTRVGSDIMPPGWTPVSKSISTLTYDVTELLNEGENTIGAVVAEGWYAGRINLRNTKKTTKHTPRLLFQLEIEDTEGKNTIVSDESWKVTQNGPIRSSKIYDGETYDAHYNLGAWTENGYDDSEWLPVVMQELSDSILLLPKRFAGVKDKRILDVQNISEPESGRVIFDFGQNNVGVPLVKVPMRKNDTLIIRFSEMLDKKGALYTDNYRSALSTDYYIADKDGFIEWRPSFTFHGYRYLELSGFDPEQKPDKEWVHAIVQYSDFEMNGTFFSSHTKLNQLQSNITWGLISNFFDIPTDCPQRDERLGWTGDAQVIAPTAIYNADMYAFWAGWLQHVRQEQLPGGGIPFVIPNCLSTNSSSGWGDACVVIPWELYIRTGDTNVLEENFEMMNKWLSYYASKANEYIVSMFSFRDWLQPFPKSGEDPKMMTRGDTPADFISTAYYARSVELTMRTAIVLGKEDQASELKLLHDSIKAAFEKRFFNADGTTLSEIETQTQYLLALEFGLLSEEKEEYAFQHLLRVIAKANDHLGTGFLGTPLLPLVLDKGGKIDLMYRIIFQETYPSWFYSINQGATTMWERWDSYTHRDGFHKEGMNSFNHYAYGAIGQWLYERVAGIKPLKPGYKEIMIAPVPGGPINSAEASYMSPYGMVSSSWRIADDLFYLDTSIPPNTTARIIIPSVPDGDLQLDGNSFSDTRFVQISKQGENSIELEALPGSYQFISRLR